jgi:hypothetical protein
LKQHADPLRRDILSDGQRVVAELAKYGTVGERRTLDEYYWFAMMDPVNHKATDAFCDWLNAVDARGP